MLIYPIQDWAEFVEQMMIAMFQKQEQSPKRVPIYSIGMQAIQISLTMKNANSFGAEPWVCAKTAGLGPRTFGVFFQHSEWNQRRLDKANNRQKWNRFNKGSTFLFQNVKFQRISAEQVTDRQEGGNVAGQKDNCADVVARSKGMVNVLAIAAATEITFEAKPVKALMAASSYFKDEERITNKTETRQDSWNIYN